MPRTRTRIRVRPVTQSIENLAGLIVKPMPHARAGNVQPGDRSVEHGYAEVMSVARDGERITITLDGGTVQRFANRPFPVARPVR